MKSKEKSETPNHVFETQGHVYVLCYNCRRKFHLYNTLTTCRCACPHCNAESPVPDTILAFHKLAEEGME